jgi:hypothetical protein
MTLRGLFLVFALAAVQASAQSDPVIEIHGVVTELGLGPGLAGAEVTLYEFAGENRERKAYATTVTDPRGEFRFHPERFDGYWVEVKKQAYFATIPVAGVSGLLTAKAPSAETGTLVTVSAAHPSQEVRLALMRPGELTGTVIDENDKPLPGKLVEITLAGLPILARALARTGPDGAFTIKMLMPGEYVVKVSSPSSSGLKSPPKFTEDDLKVLDEDLETVYWPDALDERSATPVRVNPGATASLGTIRMRKTPSYRARVSMTGCKPDDLPHLIVASAAESQGLLASVEAVPALLAFSPQVASCEDVLVTGLKPGSYAFRLHSGLGWAAAQVEVASKNLEVSLALSAGMDISGRIVAGEGVTLPALDKIRITLNPAEGSAIGAKASPPDDKGAFLVKNVMGPSHRVRVDGLGDKYYVKEIRLDGHTAHDGLVRLYQGSQLEVVLDDQPAAITGSVTEGDKPFSQPLVFAAKWPSLETTAHPVTGDNDGKFQIAGLEPGEYRIVAVQSAALPDGQQISARMLTKLWSSAEKVTLDRGGSQSVALKLSDPLR